MPPVWLLVPLCCRIQLLLKHHQQVTCVVKKSTVHAYAFWYRHQCNGEHLCVHFPKTGGTLGKVICNIIWNKSSMVFLGRWFQGIAGRPAVFANNGFWCDFPIMRSEEHTSELQSRETISYAVFCLKKKKKQKNNQNIDIYKPYIQPLYSDT